MIIVAIIMMISVALNFALARVLYRATQRLLQFDDIFQGIHPGVEGS